MAMSSVKKQKKNKEEKVFIDGELYASKNKEDMMLLLGQDDIFLICLAITEIGTISKHQVFTTFINTAGWQRI
jgi:hypothetical protein